jgi:putative endonuclease
VSTRGRAAEDAAATFLVARGLRLRERNWRCRFGEIDLVCEDGPALVFVEVRQRASAAFGGAAGSITAAKQARLVAAARQYLAGLSRPPACRFDAVLVDAACEVTDWIRDAFGE